MDNETLVKRLTVSSKSVPDPKLPLLVAKIKTQ